MTEQSQFHGWVAASQRGDRLALAKLLASCHPRLRARAEARMDPAIKVRGGPDDVLQEVYLQVFRQIDRFEDRGPASFLSWVYAILDHKLVDLQRAGRRDMRDVAREVPAAVRSDSSSYWNLFDQVYADTGTPSRVARRQEALGALLACVSGLSESHRQVIQLRFLEGLALGEVAARLGKSEAAVVALTRRALDALRASMNRLGEFTRGGGA
jgi:RNA polymerase sigma-70 factor (ECF subfamily)